MSGITREYALRSEPLVPLEPSDPIENAREALKGALVTRKNPDTRDPRDVYDSTYYSLMGSSAYDSWKHGGERPEDAALCEKLARAPRLLSVIASLEKDAGFKSRILRTLAGMARSSKGVGRAGEAIGTLARKAIGKVAPSVGRGARATAEVGARAGKSVGRKVREALDKVPTNTKITGALVGAAAASSAKDEVDKSPGKFYPRRKWSMEDIQSFMRDKRLEKRSGLGDMAASIGHFLKNRAIPAARNFAQSPLGSNVIGGLAVAGVGAGASMLMDKMRERGLDQSHQQAFAEVLRMFPDLNQADPDTLASIWATVVQFAPHVATNPRVAGTFVKRIVDFGGGQHGTPIDLPLLQSLQQLESNLTGRPNQTGMFGSASQAFGKQLGTSLGKGVVDHMNRPAAPPEEEPLDTPEAWGRRARQANNPGNRDWDPNQFGR